MASTSEVSSSPRLDPLLRDLSEKKQSFRRSVVSLAAELKDVRTRLATQEESVEREARERKIAEKRAKKMEEEIIQLQRSLKEKDEELQASTSSAEQNMKELEKLREELSSALASAEATSLSNQSAETRCFILRREIEEKNLSLKEHEERVSKLGEQLALLQKDILERECTQHSFKGDMLISTSENGKVKESDVRKILEEILPMNLEFLSKKLNAKDEEIMKLREEIRFTSAQWKHKAKELENQLERHQRADQELKKRVVKLEFCLQETRSHARRLQKMNEKREKEIEELMDKLAARNGSGEVKSSNFWESSGFKMVVSMSMLVLVVFSKRVEVKSRIQRNSTFLGSLSFSFGI